MTPRKTAGERLLPDDGIVDDIAVELAVRGQQVRLTQAEQRAVALRLAPKPGTSMQDLINALGMSHARVGELLAELGFQVRWDTLATGRNKRRIIFPADWKPASKLGAAVIGGDWFDKG